MNTNLTARHHFDGVQMITLSGPCCILPDVTHTVTVKATDYEKWRRGALCQDAFPYLSREDREFLISGTSPKGWKNLFEGFDEEEQEGIRDLVDYLDNDDNFPEDEDDS